MVRHTDSGIFYAPLYIHSFFIVQPHFLVDAEKYNIAYSSLSEIKSTAEKLRWCRYRKGLLQRDVADHVGIDRSTYVHYEELGRDLYPLDKMAKIAALFDVDTIDILDEYNAFRYRGQGEQIKTLRQEKGLTQKEYAAVLGVSAGTLINWEKNRVQMFKTTWEKLFQREIAAIQNEQMA